MKEIENLILTNKSHRRANNFRDLSGKVFFRVTPIRVIGHIPYGKSKRRLVYEAKCSCGKVFNVRGNDLVTRAIRSCGCYKKEKQIVFNKLTKTKAAYNTFSSVWQSYKCGAINRGYAFDLDKKQFYNLTQENCFYCGMIPSQHRKPRCKGKLNSFIYNGIDRLDNSLGYDMNNCVSCCGRCNRMKSDMSYMDFLAKMKIIMTLHCPSLFDL